MKEKISLKDFITIVLTMGIISFSIYYCMMPSEFVLGSVSGLVKVLVQIIPMNVSTLTFIINGGLLIVGFIFIGSDFGLKTVLTSLLLPAYMWVFEKITPVTHSITGNLVFDVAATLLTLCFGQAILFNINASTGGLDIVGKILNKYLGLKIGVSLTVAGFVIAATSVFVSGVQTMAISLIVTYVNGLVLDQFSDGFRTRKKVCIISKDYEKIRQFILNDLVRGVTLYKAIGGKMDDERIEVVTIIEKNEYLKLINFIQKEAPDAFITVSNVSEVVGIWNKHLWRNRH